MSSGSELVYGRRAVREALRGRREVVELLATERAAREPWERKAKIVPERALTELAGTRDHQGVVARVEPYRYADAYELASTGEPLLVCLDQVTDPRNLGAVCRSAEGAGATGVILPAKLPVIEPMPVVRAPTLLASESRIFKGTETFWVGAWKGKFQTLKLETEGFKSFVTDVKIHFTDGHTQTVWLNEYINSRNPCVTIDLDGARPRGIQSIEFTGANARQSTLKLVAS